MSVARITTLFEGQVSTAPGAGAALCVVHDGEVVVDVRCGEARPGVRWTERSIAPIASAGKALTVIAAAVLVDRGNLDVDQPVAHYWPEFAANGKGDVTVRCLLAHRAGLAGLDEPLTGSDFREWAPVVDALARQAPLWPPGTRQGYHLGTYGHLVGEIIRRVSGRMPSAFFADEVAAPVGCDSWIRPPESRSDDIVWPILSPPGGPPPGVDLSLAPKVFNAAADPALRERPWEVELPSGGYSTAHGLAQLYASFAGFGGSRLVDNASVDLITTGGTPEFDCLTGVNMSWGLGFITQSDALPWLRGSRTFGHPGSGGSFGFADRDERIAVAYVRSEWRPGLGGADDETAALVDAIYRTLV